MSTNGLTPGPEGGKLLGYCVRCQMRCEVAEPKQIERGGGPAIEGKCAACGAKVFIMGAELRP